MRATYDPLDRATHADPYPVYRRLRSEAPLYRNAQRGFWALSRHADVAAALNDHRRLSAGKRDRDETDRWFGIREDDYLAADSARHDALRVALRPILGARHVAALEPLVREVASELMDELAGDDPADLAAGYARRLPVLVSCRLLDLPDADEPDLRGWVDDAFAREPGSLRVPEAVDRAYHALRGRMDERLRTGPLLDAHEAGVISWDEVLDLGALIVAAGVKTTSALIGNLLLALAREPEARRWTWEAPAERAAQAVEEALRHDAPGQYVARVATEDVDTAHGTIPAGARVLLLLGSANRDPDRYPHPDRFDPTRPPQRHLAFGAGIHYCAGAALARLEGRVALTALAERAPDLRLAGRIRYLYSPAEHELDRLPCRLS